jgi:hypothetical protein
MEVNPVCQLVPRESCAKPDTNVSELALPFTRQPPSSTLLTTATISTETSTNTTATLQSPQITEASASSPPVNSPEDRITTKTKILATVFGTIGALGLLAVHYCIWLRYFKRKVQKGTEDI